ncbi:MAG: GNAT family N-acetyltransferase [Hyphomicrobiales bacterium]|nr:GNAT family N-acetyltransferase [Hyphomicrobiales bacterium]MBV9112929.1 GNAT family N-acetyltransferase [Hyphomicrobiales bacterium]MBV9520702.1 GNAT family N-acetyltransferase [Hyphomicrobiales bacterium]
MALEAKIFTSIAEIDAPAWDACFPGEAESHAYYTACAHGFNRVLKEGAIGVHDGAKLVAVAPTFKINFRLDTPFQGQLKRFSERLYPFAKGIMNLPVMGLGSPYSERCHLGFVPDLSAAQKWAALASLLSCLEADASGNGTGLVAIKDFSAPDEAAFGSAVSALGWTRGMSLPIARLDLPFADVKDYLASLSAATRKDIRRKLKNAGDIRLEWRDDLTGFEDDVARLYNSTRERSRLDYGEFEALPDNYFPSVMRALDGRARIALYFAGDDLCAFNLVLLEKNRMIDKFLGVRYPLGREHNIYAVSWMENVKECLARGIGILQTGQTAYGPKLRFGSRLEPSYVYFKHRSALPYAILRTFNRFIKADRLDPDLRAARAFTS